MSAKTACLGQSFSLILGPCPTLHVLKHLFSEFSREDQEDKVLSCPAHQGRVDCRTPRPPPLSFSCWLFVALLCLWPVKMNTLFVSGHNKRI